MGMLTAGDIMSHNPVSVSPATGIREAAQLMRTMRIRSLLVKEGAEFVGILTGTDLASRVLADDVNEDLTVGDLMSSPLLTIDRNTALHRANQQMIEHHVRHLVVVEDGFPVGILSARDLLMPEEEVPGSIPFWPHHLLKEVVAALLVMTLMVVLVAVSPAPMLDKADPFATPAHIKPEWYFLAAYQFLKFAEVFRPLGAWAPKLLGVGIMGLVVLLLVCWPFLDRNPERAPRKRPFAIFVGVISVLSFIGFTLWGHLT
ncbi:MAG: CBS domain-containing protein [Leptospirillia bacterium]